MDAQIVDCEESITYYEAVVESNHGSRVLARLQASAIYERMTCEQAVEMLKNADAYVAMMEAEPESEGPSIAEFMAAHPGLDASEEDIAEYRAGLRERAADAIDTDD